LSVIQTLDIKISLSNINFAPVLARNFVVLRN
jgi:hypothetical protein